jgi:phage repressor protein C with HTH and peptisase S24 domain
MGRLAARAYAVGVSGPSMVPTLFDGDALVAYPVRRVRPGDVVIARFCSRPDLLVVKRAIRPYGQGWWIEGDNPLVTDDSRKYGEAVVEGRVLFRYWRSDTGGGSYATVLDLASSAKNASRSRFRRSR